MNLPRVTVRSDVFLFLRRKWNRGLVFQCDQKHGGKFNSFFFRQEVEPTTWEGLKRGGDFFLPSWLKHKFQVSSCREARHQSKTTKNKQHTFTENNRLAKTISRIFINVYDFVRLTPNLLQFFVFFNLLQVLCYFLRLCMLRLFRH